MRCSRLIMIFGMLFCLSFVMVGYKRYVLRTVLKQKDRIDRAAAWAADVAATNLAKGIYEPDACLTAYEVYELALSAALEDEIPHLERVLVSINGKLVQTDDEPASAKRGDEVKICFELKGFTIRAPGRELSYEFTVYRVVTLD